MAKIAPSDGGKNDDDDDDELILVTAIATDRYYYKLIGVKQITCIHVIRRRPEFVK